MASPKMNPEIKALWLDALTSGEYEQGKDRLRTSGNTYCCLGVLCQLASDAGVIDAPIRRTGGYSYVGYDVYLPGSVMKWAGLDNRSGMIYTDSVDGDDDVRISLANMNDGGKSFEVIAETIEKHL